MAEAQANGLGDAPASESPTPADTFDRGTSPVISPLGSDEDALLLPELTSDDTPTIISKKVPAPAVSEDALAGVLRGKRLAHYELLAPIGVGGMAAVIRAHDTQLDRSVALKILPPEMASDAENVRRFHQEARAAAKLDHENIARAFFCGEDQGLHFIAFEYVEGENLRTLVEQRGRIPVVEALHYTLQIATGLVHAAARGVVHRDIKPSNIIISPNGRAKLVDMGLARSLHHDNGLTQSGVTLGTFDYISPEQAMEPRDADGRSDIYSLGCTAYHMLTGQPPVPEGTAARKLHHHQYVEPPDPRQVNPEVPDEAAALLARMMAKEPKDRYQRPEDLVEHLLYLVDKFGTASARKDGVLFVEAPAPSPQQTRPWLLVGLGVAALIVLIVLFAPSNGRDLTSGQRTEHGRADAAGKGLEPRPPGEDPDDKPILRGKTGPTAELRTTKVDPGKSAPQPTTVQTARELGELLDRQGNVSILLGSDLRLTNRDETWTISGDVTLQGEPGKRPTISLTYDASAGSDPWAAITLRAGRVRLSNLRFVIDATEAPDLVMSALAVHGGQLTVENCEFVQLRPPVGGLGSLSAALVAPLPSGLDHEARTPEGIPRQPRSRPPREPANVDKPTLVFRQSLFLGGQRAVTATTAASIHLMNCAFGPFSGADFALQGTGVTDLQLRHCSLILGDGPAVRLQDTASVYLEVRESVLAGSRPSAATLRGDADQLPKAVLIHQAGTSTGIVRYLGQNNAYHGLKAYWQLPQGTEVARYSEFRKRVSQDDRSHELSTTPWQDADPLAALRRNDYRQAFQLTASLPQVRTVTDVAKAIGVLHGPGWEYDAMPRLEERKPAEAVARKEKIVDPSVTESSDGIYPTLAQAVLDARPSDVILIRHNGRLLVETVRLEKANLDLTIKPHPESKPILTLGATPDAEAALFRLHDGKLRLEGLEFLLPPPRDDFRTQTLVAMLGDGQCLFKDCAVTLEETRNVQMAMVTLVDSSAVMRMGAAARSQGPLVRVEGCFVRGAGDLLSVRPSRPFDLQLDDALVTLEGSLVTVDGSPRDLAVGPLSQVQLNRVTAYLTDHLLWLRAAREEGRAGRGLVPIHAQFNQCLFAAANGKSLVHLDGVDTDEQMKRLFAWNGGRGNLYSSFSQMLDQQPREPEMMSVQSYDRTRWENFTRETDARFDRVRFTSAPVEGQYQRATPSDFKVKADAELQGCGADLDRLPVPTSPGGDSE